MDSPIRPQDSSSLDRWITKPWLGYGLVAFCTTLLLFSLSGFSPAIGLGSGNLMTALAPLAFFGSLMCFGGALASRIAARIVEHDVIIPPRRKYSRIAGGIFVASLVLGVFNLFVASSRSYEFATAMETYELVGGNLSVTVPGRFAVDPQIGHSENGIGLHSELEGISIIATARPEGDYAMSDMALFAKATAQKAMKDFQSPEMIESNSWDLDGTTIIRNRFKHELDGLLFELLIEHQQIGEYWCELRCATTPSKFREFQDQFDLISQSLRQP